MSRDEQADEQLPPARVTISHVARRAGVSPTTVSHVLSGKRLVGAATRSTVLDAIRELGYRPNHVARNLRTRQSHMIAVVVPDITNPFYAVLTRGLADAVDAAGPAEEPVTAVALPVIGDLEGVVLMIFSVENAARLCSVLGVDSETEMGLSALNEIGNIVGASYLGALGTTTGQSIEPGPPQAATDMLGALVSSILASSAETADVALLLDSALRVEGGNDASISFILVPSTASVRELLAKLGIE